MESNYEKDLFHVCTVVTASHLCYARALTASLRKFHPHARHHVLVIDGHQHCLNPPDEGMTLYSASDLELQNSQQFFFRYNAFEACNALKAFFCLNIRHRFPKDLLIYMDGDMLLVGCLGKYIQELRGCSVLLSPHRLGSIAESRERHVSVMPYGVFNAGIVGIGSHEEGDRFLEWWAQCCEHDCVDKPRTGLFVDQKFLDYVPVLFPLSSVYRGADVNIATFNFDERNPRLDSGCWMTDGSQVSLFHFTHFRPDQGWWDTFERDSKLGHQLAHLPKLAQDYTDLLYHYGFDQGRLLQYGYGKTSDGIAITQEMRWEFASQEDRGKAAEMPGNPFDVPKRWVTSRAKLPLLDRIALRCAAIVRIPLKPLKQLGRRY